MRALLVSPHADDVCLSLSGVVASMVVQKHLVTVFSRSMWVEPEWDGPRGADAVTDVRTREDRAYCDLAGSTLHCLSLPDSSIRHGQGGDLRLPTGDEARVAAQVEAGILGLVKEDSFDVLVAPLGLGGHTDHVVCRDAARSVGRATGAATFYYEDLPYAGSLTTWAIARSARRFDRALRPLVCLTPMSVGTKLEMADMYETQRTETIRDAILGHSRRLSGKRRPLRPGSTPRGELVVERLWCAAEPQLAEELLGGRLETRTRSRSVVRAAAGA